MIYDAHFHILDTFTVSDYLEKIKDLNVKGGALIACSFQGYEQEFLIQALKTLGNNFVGITQLPIETSDKEIIRLNTQGIRGVRFPLYRGASAKNLVSFAKRIYDLVGWHVELYTDKIDELKDTILQLPKVSIDHLGLSKTGLKDLISLTDHGVMVKASGFYRVNFDVKEALQNMNPEALMFGTDLPGTRAKRTFSQEDLDLIRNTINKDACEKIFWANAKEFYT